MRIAIASGKGGTGKTTIATNLVRSLERSGKVVQYLDCDVEEPNGHIFLKPEITDTQTVSIVVPEVDHDTCTHCGKCGALCQYSAIVCLPQKVMTFEALCHSCGGCMLVCPTKAITQKQRPIGIVDSGLSGDAVFGHGKLTIGDIHSVALIHQVKTLSLDEGIVILDAPPGTSCPVIEAVKDADFVLLVTEPTPFGLNDLKLAVDMVRKLTIPFAVVINRSRPDDRMTHDYCKHENIEVIFEVPDDRRIAEAYSVGTMMVDALPEYQEGFIGLYEAVSASMSKQKKGGI